MATTIQISEKLRRELKVLASQRDLSYEELVADLIEVFETAAPFQTEAEFADWFEENLGKFGFKEIVEKRKKDSPDYRLKDHQGETREVELEIIGKNFVSHGHDPEKTDLIVCLFSEKEEIEGVPVISVISQKELKEKIIERPEISHTSITIPMKLREDLEELISDTGFQNASEFTKFVLRDIVSQGGFEGPEELNDTVEKVRDRLRNLGYIEG